MQDTRDAARVVNQLPNIDFVCPFGTPNDVLEDQATPVSFQVLIEFTDKPIAFVTHNLDNMREVYEIAARQVGSMKKLAEKPFLIMLLESCTSFVFPEETLKRFFGAPSIKCRFALILPFRWTLLRLSRLPGH